MAALALERLFVFGEPRFGLALHARRLIHDAQDRGLAILERGPQLRAHHLDERPVEHESVEDPEAEGGGHARRTEQEARLDALPFAERAVEPIDVGEGRDVVLAVRGVLGVTRRSVVPFRAGGRHGDEGYAEKEARYEGAHQLTLRPRTCSASSVAMRSDSRPTSN